MTNEDRAAVRDFLDDARGAAVRAIRRACNDAQASEATGHSAEQRVNAVFRDLMAILEAKQ